MKKLHKLNGEVRFAEVRLIGRENSRVLSSREAFQIATEEEKDLILINENANPPLVQIEEYSKFLYNLEKAEKAKKKNQQPELKEIQLSPEIGENDLKTKAKKASELLGEGSKVKCVLSMKGRQKGRPERGEHTMLKFLELLLESGTPESLPKLEGSKWITTIKPKK